MSVEVVLDVAAVTVEYDRVRGQDAVLIVPFPSGEGGVALHGSLADLRAVVDSIDGLLCDLEASS